MLYTRISVVNSLLIFTNYCSNIFAIETVIHKSVRSVTETDTPSLRSESGTSITARGGIFAGELTILYHFLCQRSM